MKKEIKKMISILLRPYFYLYGSWPMWFFIFNHEPRKLLQGDSRTPAEVEKRLIHELKEKGIASVHIDELFSGKNILPILKQYADSLLPLAKIRPGKEFLRALWEDDNVLDLTNPFMQLALSDEVLSIVNGYTDMYSKFFYSSLDLTMPVGDGSSPIRSQNWHRDPEDRKMCKMFLYLTDVDESSGPFMYIQSSHVDGRYGIFFPQRPPKGSYPAEDDVNRLIFKEDIQVCMGKAGTILFADTAGLHRGGYATGKSRLMFTAEYSSIASLRPIKYRFPENFKSNKTLLGSAARFATDNNFGWTRFFRLPSDLAIKYGIYD